VERASLEVIAGGDAAENAEMIRGVLGGERGARRDVVVMNAAAALVAAGRAGDFREGAKRAAEAIHSGAARKKLEELRGFSKLPG